MENLRAFVNGEPVNVDKQIAMDRKKEKNKMSMLDKNYYYVTHNDKTVPDAIEVFEENKDLPIQYWGFKDVGMEPVNMKVLCSKMRAAGRHLFWK